VNRDDLIAAIAQDTEAPKTVIRRVLDSMVEQIHANVARGKPVKVARFGKFDSTTLAARNWRSPRTGKTIQIPPVTRPRFTPSRAFKAAIKRHR